MCSDVISYDQFQSDVVLGLSPSGLTLGLLEKVLVLFPLLQGYRSRCSGLFTALRCDFRVMLGDVRLSTGKQNNILESRTGRLVMVKRSKVLSSYEMMKRIKN